MIWSKFGVLRKQAEFLTPFVTDALISVTVFEQTHEDKALPLLTKTAAFIPFDNILTTEAHSHLGRHEL
jgi:hypothetical protein